MSDNNNSSASSGGIGALGLLGIIFVLLKLFGLTAVATWSWWLVTLPLWFGIAVLIAIVVIGALFAGIDTLLS